MPDWIELYTPGDSALLVLTRGYRNQAQAYREQTGQDRETTGADREAVETKAGEVEAAREQVETNRGLVQADREAVETKAGEVEAARAQVETNRGLAAASASTATTQAGIATAQAGISATQALAAQQSAAAAAASVPATADRTVGRRASDTSVWTFTRATPAWGFGPDGALVETPIDTLRWEFDAVTRAPLGAAFAGAATNVFSNPRMEGGTPGTPGTPPTGTQAWGGAIAGLTIEYVQNVTALGLSGVRYRLSGTPSGSSNVVWSFAPTNAGWTPAAQDETWTATTWVALAAGSLTNVSVIRNIVSSRFSTGTAGVNTNGADFKGSLTSTPQPFSTTRTNATTTITGIFHQLAITVTAGQPIDLTLDIFAPQLKRMPLRDAPSFPPIGAPAASTRAQGNATITAAQLGSRLSRRQGLIIIDWNSQPGPFTSATDADWFGLVSWGDTTADNRMGLLINPAHTSIEARCTAGGVVQTASAVTISAPAAGLTTRAAVAWDLDAGFLQVAARGTAGSKVALTAAPAVLSHLMIGRYATSNPLFGRVQGLECRPGALFDASLAALT